MAYTTTPVTETYSQMGSVKRAILRCCRKRPLEREEERGQHHRQGYHRQHNVADQNAQIDRPDRAKSRKMRLSMQRMVGDVANQKEGRENKRYRSSTRDGQEYSAGE